MIQNQNIIDGKKMAAKLLDVLASQITTSYHTYRKIPKLVIILIGSNYASGIYVNNKLKAAKKVGMEAVKISLPENTTTQELLSVIHQLNDDLTVSGIVVQLPLPGTISKKEILAAIDPEKDVDGFHPLNVGYLNSGINKGLVPSTALGCLALIKKCEANLAGRHAVIVNRSEIVGRPLAALLIKQNVTVTICHSHTVNLSSITKNADIVIAAIGVAQFFDSTFFNPDSIVIDVGINRGQNNKIIGDVDFINVVQHVKYISPVPGGVGPMTIVFLLINSFKAFVRQNQLPEFLNV